MKVLTKTVETYKYGELSESAKEKALEKMCDINVDYDWWENVYEDAATVGIKITDFNIDRGSYCDGDFMHDAEEVASLIIKNHGESCETFKTASAFLKEHKEAFEAMEKAEDGEILNYQDEQTLTDIAEEFKKSILEDFRIILTKEYEYLTGREAIEETIRANEYDFTKEGNFPAL